MIADTFTQAEPIGPAECGSNLDSGSTYRIHGVRFRMFFHVVGGRAKGGEAKAIGARRVVETVGARCCFTKDPQEFQTLDVLNQRVLFLMIADFVQRGFSG